LISGSSSSEDDDEVEAFEEVKKFSPAKVLPRKSSLKKKAIAQYNNVEFSDGYDEEFYGDEADRAKLMAMTEIEREAVLYERAQAVFCWLLRVFLIISIETSQS
jgi:hypothetical protein